MYVKPLETPIGRLLIAGDDQVLRNIVLPGTAREPADWTPAPGDHPLLGEAVRQLGEYFAGARQCFDLPLAPRGTDFQRAAWKLMQEIPFGATRTYGELAAALGNPNLARAVGGAANRNPLPIVIPCHRVMGSGNRLTGFAAGLAVKRFLLAHEGVALLHND
jgi:methylated-DNA-[protein]-cysteine S-methyltransferase